LPCFTENNVKLCQRLIRAYKYSVLQGRENSLSQPKDDLWTGIIKDELRPLVTILDKGDAVGLLEFLIQFGGEYRWFGGITTGIDGYNHWDQSVDTIAQTYLDKLICLAESLGVLPVEVPEFGEIGNWGLNASFTPEQIASTISEKLKIDIVPPTGVIPVSGLKIQNGVLHYRHINALYSAIRIRSLVEKGSHICEIGGGLGFVAYYLSLLGKYKTTLYDLPIVNVLSGFVLISMLGDKSVALEGEEGKDASIRISSFWNFSKSEDNEYDIVFNQDSFPEIQRNILDFYVENISRACKGYFLSINHEASHKISETNSHTTVRDLLQDNPRFDCNLRYPYWLRRGYVEELYLVSSCESDGSDE